MSALTPEELELFNKDLAELCAKHNVTVNIAHQLLVEKKETKPETK